MLVNKKYFNLCPPLNFNRSVQVVRGKTVIGAKVSLMCNALTLKYDT
jgi:hypothetical protein